MVITMRILEALFTGAIIFAFVSVAMADEVKPVKHTEQTTLDTDKQYQAEIEYEIQQTAKNNQFKYKWIKKPE